MFRCRYSEWNNPQQTESNESKKRAEGTILAAEVVERGWTHGTTVHVIRDVKSEKR